MVVSARECVPRAIGVLGASAANVGVHVYGERAILVRVTNKNKSELFCHRQSVRICFLLSFFTD